MAAVRRREGEEEGEEEERLLPIRREEEEGLHSFLCCVRSFSPICCEEASFYRKMRIGEQVLLFSCFFIFISFIVLILIFCNVNSVLFSETNCGLKAQII
ncbi:hypothetical protein LINPERHAP2_LOCUS6367 [Linum perenne]